MCALYWAWLKGKKGEQREIGEKEKGGLQDGHVVPRRASSAHLLGILALGVGADASADDIDLEEWKG